MTWRTATTPDNTQHWRCRRWKSYGNAIKIRPSLIRFGMDLPGNGNWIRCGDSTKGLSKLLWIWRLHCKKRSSLIAPEVERVYIYIELDAAPHARDKNKSLGVHDSSMMLPCVILPKKISLQKNCSCLEHDLLEALMMWNPSNPVHTPSGWDPTHSLKHSCRTLGKVNSVNPYALSILTCCFNRSKAGYFLSESETVPICPNVCVYVSDVVEFFEVQPFPVF